LKQRGGRRTWAAGLLVAAAALGPASATCTADPIVAGVRDVGLGGAVSISYGTRDGLNTVTGLQLLPHVGFVVSDATGPGWLRGNLEMLAEPTLMHLDSEVGTSTVVGLSGLARWIFAGRGRFRPYVAAGVGVLVGETSLQQTDCDVNFLLQAGPGLLVVLSDTTVLTVGYRFQHVSNASLCSYNPGINSGALYLGVSYFFR
jgi:opacity protein-like surface antigen